MSPVILFLLLPFRSVPIESIGTQFLYFVEMFGAPVGQDQTKPHPSKQQVREVADTLCLSREGDLSPQYQRARDLFQITLI